MFTQIIRWQLGIQIAVAGYIMTPPQQIDFQEASLVVKEVVAAENYVITPMQLRDNQVNSQPLKAEAEALSQVRVSSHLFKEACSSSTPVTCAWIVINQTEACVWIKWGYLQHVVSQFMQLLLLQHVVALHQDCSKGVQLSQLLHLQQVVASHQDHSNGSSFLGCCTRSKWWCCIGTTAMWSSFFSCCTCSKWWHCARTMAWGSRLHSSVTEHL